METSGRDLTGGQGSIDGQRPLAIAHPLINANPNAKSIAAIPIAQQGQRAGQCEQGCLQEFAE